MTQSAYLYFVEGSAFPSLPIEDVQSELQQYKQQLQLTGKQLGWDYSEAAFPYTIEVTSQADQRWLLLKGTNALYRYVAVGSYVAPEEATEERNYVQITLPDGFTKGDKAKANEFCKFLAKKWKCQLHLFNGRVMYFNPRK